MSFASRTQLALDLSDPDPRPVAPPFRTTLRCLTDEAIAERNRAEGRKGALAFQPVEEAVESITTARAPTRQRVLSWVQHPDERVVLALLDYERSINLRNYVSREGVPPKKERGIERTGPAYRHLSQHLEDRALDDAEAEGVLWTPVLDALHAIQPGPGRLCYRGEDVNFFYRSEDRTGRLQALSRWAASQEEPDALLPLLAFESKEAQRTFLQEVPGLPRPFTEAFVRHFGYQGLTADMHPDPGLLDEAVTEAVRALRHHGSDIAGERDSIARARRGVELPYLGGLMAAASGTGNPLPNGTVETLREIVRDPVYGILRRSAAAGLAATPTATLADIQDIVALPSSIANQAVPYCIHHPAADASVILSVLSAHSAVPNAIEMVRSTPHVSDPDVATELARLATPHDLIRLIDRSSGEALGIYLARHLDASFEYQSLAAALRQAQIEGRLDGVLPHHWDAYRRRSKDEMFAALMHIPSALADASFLAAARDKVESPRVLFDILMVAAVPDSLVPLWERLVEIAPNLAIDALTRRAEAFRPYMHPRLITRLLAHEDARVRQRALLLLPDLIDEREGTLCRDAEPTVRPPSRG